MSEPALRPSGPPGRLSLLVADPDPAVAATVASALSARGAEVATCADGAAALLRVGATRPDVVLVNTGLPVVPGVAVTRAIRERRAAAVIVGIGPGDAGLVEEILAAGASACVARPYRIPELMPLLAGIRPDAGLERTEILRAGALVVDPQSYEARLAGTPVELTVREFELLTFLLRNSDRVVTFEQILSAVWGNPDSATNTLAVHIRRLRLKLGDNLRRPQLIRNVRGLGYRLVLPEEPVARTDQTWPTVTTTQRGEATGPDSVSSSASAVPQQLDAVSG